MPGSHIESQRNGTDSCADFTLNEACCHTFNFKIIDHVCFFRLIAKLIALPIVSYSFL